MSKIKDSKLGNWLRERNPKVLEVFGDLMPDKGVLGVLGKVIDNISETPEELDKAHAHLKELYAIEVEDRDSARRREVEVAKERDFDLLFNVTGLISLGAFVFIVYAIVYEEIPEENNEVWIHLIGIVEGVVMSIVMYFFGSTMKKNR